MTEQQFKVLLIEDNPGDARLIQESLSGTDGGSFEVEIADRLAPALRRLAGGGFDAVLLDLGLPDSNGPETFAQAKKEAHSVPIIVLTGLGDEALAVKMVQEGAQDYVTKPEVSGGILSRVIRYAIAREQAEQQIRAFNQELEQRVKVRTAELEAAYKEMEAFSSAVSHDLRAPLRHINGYAAILAEALSPEADPEVSKCLARISEASTRMGALIDDLLKLSRAGQQMLTLETTALGMVVYRVIAEMRRDTEGRSIEWKVDDLPSVLCDEGLVRQVLGNLIGNAVKYTRKRALALIEIGQTRALGRHAFFVRDNGIGFDMKYADKLFGAFQRLHSDKDFEGTGIGLATVKRIVQRHGGRIWAEAEPEKGATFFFTLEPEAASLRSEYQVA